MMLCKNLIFLLNRFIFYDLSNFFVIKRDLHYHFKYFLSVSRGLVQHSSPINHFQNIFTGELFQLSENFIIFDVCHLSGNPSNSKLGMPVQILDEMCIFPIIVIFVLQKLFNEFHFTFVHHLDVPLCFYVFEKS